MKSAEIRELFLRYFEQAGHQRVPSASLIPSSYDPSVLLTTAGMQPFKPYFQGQETPPRPRLTSVQKCFRTPDIDSVGLTARHNTFFEMLGNFSFGDYFKQGAIELAWQLVAGELALDPQRLWATVHAGDPSLGLGIDDEAVELWVAQGLPRERIVALGEDNFWKAGATGPCGPCSEVYYDRGEEFQVGCPDPATCRPGCECDRYLEFYNLVFMQYERDDAGTLAPLPSQNIDTGMGLERISMLKQDVRSVYEIDTFRTVIVWAEQASGRSYDDGDAATTKAFRVLADHGRGMTFLASDGVMPSNEGRGYVLRRIIRRAIQHADRIGLYEGGGGVLEALSQRVVDAYADVYPELREQRAAVVELLAAEEERFLRTLARGNEMLQGVFRSAGAGGVVSGDEAFQLHDTFGFPVELTRELCQEHGLTLDRTRFDELMRAQRERARAAAGGGSLPVEEAAALVRSAPQSEFVGFETLLTTAEVTVLQELDGQEGARRVLVKLSRSPFYAEGGGQVSDTGTITGAAGRLLVQHVLRFEGDQVIVALVEDGTVAAGEQVQAQVEASARRATEANHTATHLLHRALRDRLGAHVRQAGSLVAPDRLRFDFTHPASLAADDLAAIEAQVNEEVARADEVQWSEMALEAARERGAMMLFGEKYGDVVRVVDVGDGWSRELCGGTHVSNTAQIRLLVVTGESSVGANTRRIEAVTGARAIEYLRSRAQAADAAAAAANVDVVSLPARVEELATANRQLERELASLRSGADLDNALARREQVGDLSLVVYRSDSLSADELLELSDRLKQKLAPAAVLVGGARDGKVALIANVSEDATGLGVDASALIREISGIVGGGGGGRATMARAGGKDPGRLDEALEAGREAVRRAVAAAGNGSA